MEILVKLAWVGLFLILVAPFVWSIWRSIDRWADKADAAVKKAIAEQESVPETVRGILTPQQYASFCEISKAMDTATAGGPEYHREFFKDGPIGEWHGWRDDSVMMAQYWVFRSDHTGETVNSGVMARSEYKSVFEWEPVGDCVIRIREKAFFTCLLDDGSVGSEWRDTAELDGEKNHAIDESDEEMWDTVAYDFRLEDGGYCPQIVMHEVGKQGFCWPLQLDEQPLVFDSFSVPGFLKFEPSGVSNAP